MRFELSKKILIILSVLLFPISSFSVARLYTRTTGSVISGPNDDAEWDNTNNAINTHTDASSSVHGISGSVVGTSGTQTLSGKTLSAATITGSSTAETLTVLTLGTTSQGLTSNLGLSLSAGTLTVVDADGDTLTSSNPGAVAVPSTTAGETEVLMVTSEGSFNDDSHASSDLTNLGFGITEAQDWAQDMPYFLYVANRSNTDIDGSDGTSVFFIARNPTMTITPAAANNIGDTGAIPVNDSQNVILILDDVTVADYTGLPCQLIGTFRMRWASATADWTVQTLSAGGGNGQLDGIGQKSLNSAFNTRWTYPQQQNGAEASSHLLANGGTVPIFTTNSYFYKISNNGHVRVWIYLNADGGTDGIGGSTAQVTLPSAESSGAITDGAYGVANCLDQTNASYQASIMINDADLFFTMNFEPPAGGVLDTVQNADYTNGNRTIQTSFEYWSFIPIP